MNTFIGDVDNKQDEQRLLIECNNRQDLFDVFVRTILAHAPSVYVFINLTLLIWIGQTIFNSKLNAIPRSLYLITPYFTDPPLVNIVLSPPNSPCPQNTTLLVLKTFPTIFQNHISRQLVSNWDDPAFQFCVQVLSDSSHSSFCTDNMTFCSGYCTDSKSQCPITNIKVSNSPALENGYQQFHQQNGRYYQLTRNQGTPVVGLTVAYGSMCANDEHYSESLENQTQYWSAVKNCGQEGTLKSVFNIVDQMQTNTFLANNQIPLTTTDPDAQMVLLGAMKEFTLSDNQKQGCADARQQAVDIQPHLQGNLITPLFTQSLLIISFILLVVELIWLLAYYCFDGMAFEKNLIMVMLAVIEVVVIGFIYSDNLTLFEVEKMSDTLAKCLKQELPALKSWHFGIDSPQVFQMVLFVNTIFLALYLLALLLSRFVFMQYLKLEIKLPKKPERRNH